MLCGWPAALHLWNILNEQTNHYVHIDEEKTQEPEIGEHS